MTKNDGGPALPTDGRIVPGMRLRDYFAAQAMQAVVRVATMPGAGKHGGGMINELDIAASAYALADAMLTERAK